MCLLDEARNMQRGLKKYLLPEYNQKVRDHFANVYRNDKGLIGARKCNFTSANGFDEDVIKT